MSSQKNGLEWLEEAAKNALPAFGQMNRSNRIYFDMISSEMADELRIGIVELSAYETGRKPVPEDIERRVLEYWSRRFYSKARGDL